MTNQENIQVRLNTALKFSSSELAGIIADPHEELSGEVVVQDNFKHIIGKKLLEVTKHPLAENLYIFKIEAYDYTSESTAEKEFQLLMEPENFDTVENHINIHW